MAELAFLQPDQPTDDIEKRKRQRQKKAREERRRERRIEMEENQRQGRCKSKGAVCGLCPVWLCAAACLCSAIPLPYSSHEACGKVRMACVRHGG